MPVAKGTVFACSECGVAGHTRVGCPQRLASAFPVGSTVGENSTVLSVEPKRVRLRCSCGVEFARTPGTIQRQHRDCDRVTCGRWQCRTTRRPTDKQYVSTLERVLNGW